MAAPSVPTLDSLVAEGLSKAGISSPSAPQTTQAEGWMEEIKADIWILGKTLNPLMTEHVEVLTPGISRYDFPAAASSVLTARCFYGDELGDVQAATAATITLDEDEDDGEDELEGEELFIYSGTGKGELSRIYSYDDDTLIASVHPAWGTQPVADDEYVKVQDTIELNIQSVVYYDKIQSNAQPGRPESMFPIGSGNNYGYYELYPIPDTEDDHYYAVHMRYFVNLMTLDLTGDRIKILYQRWRNLWMQGIKARRLDQDDDNRAGVEMQKYFAMVKDTVALEAYGRNIKQSYTNVGA
jgi:hypothetical protein